MAPANEVRITINEDGSSVAKVYLLPPGGNAGLMYNGQKKWVQDDPEASHIRMDAIALAEANSCERVIMDDGTLVWSRDSE